MKELEYWKFKYKNDSWIQIYERDLKTGQAKTKDDFTQAAEKALSFYKENGFMDITRAKGYLQKKHSLKAIIQWYNMIFNFNNQQGV